METRNLENRDDGTAAGAGSRGYHDIGGTRIAGAATLSTASDAPPDWASLTDALRSALGDRYRIHEQRRKIEELGPEIYDSVSYYEIRVLAMREMLLEKGLLSASEIDDRMAEIRARETQREE